MILVDTSVWIDFFNGKELPHVTTLTIKILQRLHSTIHCELVKAIKTAAIFTLKNQLNTL
jgi:predicted nucleic acid-binding protein